MWVKKLLISPVKKRIFCPKTTKYGPKLAFLVDMGQAMQVFSVPCWWVSWWLWRTGCISQDTYLLYVLQNDAKLTTDFYWPARTDISMRDTGWHSCSCVRGLTFCLRFVSVFVTFQIRLKPMLVLGLHMPCFYELPNIDTTVRIENFHKTEKFYHL